MHVYIFITKGIRKGNWTQRISTVRKIQTSCLLASRSVSFSNVGHHTDNRYGDLNHDRG